MQGGEGMREGNGAAHTHTHTHTHTLYLQRNGVGDLAVKHEEDGKLGIAGPGLAKEVDGLLIGKGGREGGNQGGSEREKRELEREGEYCDPALPAGESPWYSFPGSNPRGERRCWHRSGYWPGHLQTTRLPRCGGHTP